MNSLSCSRMMLTTLTTSTAPTAGTLRGCDEGAGHMEVWPYLGNIAAGEGEPEDRGAVLRMGVDRGRTGLKGTYTQNSFE